MSIKGKRTTKTAILIVGEGPTEKAFLQHLKELFISRDAEVAIKIESGSGGAPNCVIQKAIRLRENMAYNHCFVLIDSDRPIENDPELEIRIKKKPPIKILKTSPCIEGLFLAILQYTSFSPTNASSNECKSLFEKNYISADKKTDKRSYNEIFTQEIINNRRKNLPQLEEILRAMQI